LSALDAEFAAILDGAAEAADIAAFLSRTLPLMADPEALAAGARALRSRMIKVAAPANAIDVCGTGGDAASTLNISTAVALVVAGCGVPVAKHGNRAMSSACGAADVLEALGVKLTADVAALERCLGEANVAFLFAQHHHPAMRHVAAARRAFGQRTIFNLLGPLSNPAGVKRQLLGVFAAEFVQPMADALRLLGAERAWVIHGAGGLDELAAAESNLVVELDRGATRAQAIAFVGHDAFDHVSALRGGGAEGNARALRALLAGASENECYRQAVELNAAAALVAAGAASELGEAALLARESLDCGAALDALDALIAISRSAP
jgi:anthranilate phosphoribosyltransferase